MHLSDEDTRGSLLSWIAVMNAVPVQSFGLTQSRIFSLQGCATKGEQLSELRRIKQFRFHRTRSQHNENTIFEEWRHEWRLAEGISCETHCISGRPSLYNSSRGSWFKSWIHWTFFLKRNDWNNAVRLFTCTEMNSNHQLQKKRAIVFNLFSEQSGGHDGTSCFGRDLGCSSICVENSGIQSDDNDIESAGDIDFNEQVPSAHLQTCGDARCTGIMAFIVHSPVLRNILPTTGFCPCNYKGSRAYQIGFRLLRMYLEKLLPLTKYHSRLHFKSNPI